MDPFHGLYSCHPTCITPLQFSTSNITAPTWLNSFSCTSNIISINFTRFDTWGNSGLIIFARLECCTAMIGSSLPTPDERGTSVGRTDLWGRRPFLLRRGGLNCVEQSRFWHGNSSSASQRIPCALFNPNNHYCFKRTACACCAPDQSSPRSPILCL
jgi:hypothetical protein